MRALLATDSQPYPQLQLVYSSVLSVNASIVLKGFRCVVPHDGWTVVVGDISTVCASRHEAPRSGPPNLTPSSWHHAVRLDKPRRYARDPSLLEFADEGRSLDRL